MTESLTPNSAENSPSEDPLYHTLEWVLQSLDDPARAAADWVAQEVDPSRPSASALLGDPQTPLSRVVRARSFYMALRADGDSTPERTLGGRMAMVAAAAALVYHNERITPHDDTALAAAFRAAEQDSSVPAGLRQLLKRAIDALPTA